VTTIFGFHKPPVQAVCKSPGKSTLIATTNPDPVASVPPTTAFAGVGKSPINKAKIEINELDIYVYDHKFYDNLYKYNLPYLIYLLDINIYLYNDYLLLYNEQK
jgi:hypothetical protein